MSDLETLRKALDIMERAQRSGLKADEWTTFKTARVLQAAARRFLALTETGPEKPWCVTHESSANHAQAGEYCDYSIENTYCFTPCSMVRVLVIPADYL